MIRLVQLDEYAENVVNQHDQQYVRNDWANPENAQNRVIETYATGAYTKKGTTYYKPHILYGYEFPLSIPENAVVTSLKFVVRMKSSKNLDVKAPAALFVSYKKGIFSPDRSEGCPKTTGDCNGRYRVVPTEKVGKSWHNVTYEMPKEKLGKFEDIHRSFTQQGFGIQLMCQDAKSTGNLYIKYIRCIIEYEVPQRYLTFEGVSADPENPTDVAYGEPYQLVLKTGNTSIASDVQRTFNLSLPLGFEVTNYKTTGKNTVYNPTNQTWKVDGGAGKSNTLTLTVIPKATGAKEIRAFLEETKWYGAYFYIANAKGTNYGQTDIIPRNMQRGEKSCIDVYHHFQSAWANCIVRINLPGGNLTSADLISCELLEDATSEDVSLGNVTVTPTYITVNMTVPTEKTLQLGYRICYYPRTHGNNLPITATSTPSFTNYNGTIDIAPPKEKHIIFNKDVETSKCTQTIQFRSNRIISQIEGDVAVLPIHVDDYDKDMYVNLSTFGINQWKKSRYIGCVEVPFAHYEPEHNSKDKLLDEHYKSKHYLGKENAVDEDISLKIRVPRRKTPTLIGLVNIDRPIPVNLVPDAFENDPLNHRGWAEIYGVKVKPTNPLYDDCDIDLKYITHNIISRFNIYLGNVINEFDLPNVLSDSLVSGGDIGEFFNIQTDGSYVYDEEDFTVHRNLFAFKNNQDILMRSKELLASKSRFEVYWDSVKFDEIRENNISRFIRLVDSQDNVVFEYEYFDFDFDGEVYTCDVMGRVLTDSGYKPEINREIYLHSDVEFTDDENDEDYDDEGVDLYGSSVVFELDNNKLNILEKGFSGLEFTQSLTLPVGKYYLEIYWKNNNQDADTGNSLQYFNVEVSELTVDANLSEYYNKLVVSPYPVPRKKIVFTRESEEGTIYYLENDGEEFNFLLEPFYQYKCGVDLVGDGASIFDFNNSYPVIYIQNGLIRFGINRLNGDLYLDKWDVGSKQYIRTNRFRIEKFDDAQVTTLNDDIIIVNVSDITITMWRGRPYVLLQHEFEDIAILDRFTQVFADAIGDNTPSEYPVIWNLYNSQNLLPECVGGTKLLKSSCVTVTEDDTALNDLGSFIITANKTECYYGEEIIVTLNGNFSNGTVSLICNDEVIATNVGNTITAVTPDPGLMTLYCVYLGNDTTNIEVSNILAVNVLWNDYAPESVWKLELISSKKIKYNQGTVDFKLTHNGVGVADYEVLVSNPHQTWHWISNSNGIAKTPNRQVPAGKHYWIATVHSNGELIAQTKVKITVEENTPQIIAITTNIKRGGKAVFQLLNEDKTPMQNEKVDITIGGTKYVRTTDTNGKFKIKLKGGDEGRSVEYTAKIKYVGEKKRYKTVSKTFSICVVG